MSSSWDDLGVAPPSKPQQGKPQPPAGSAWDALGVQPPSGSTAGGTPATPSVGAQLLHGFEAPLVGLDTLASKIEQHLPFVPAATAASDVAAAVKQQADFAKRGTNSWWETAGSIANPINYLVPGGAATKLGRAAMAAGSGAASAAVEPAPIDDYWSAKTKQILGGAAAGEVGHVALGALGNLIAPTLSADAAKLADKGVQLTPGQMGTGGGMVGRQVRRAEEAFKSFPILGSFIRSGEGRSIESFNRATIDQALEPIKQKLPKGVDEGHEAVKWADQKVSDAYDLLLPHVSFGTDRQFAADIASLQGAVQSMPPAQINQFTNILNHRLGTRLAPNGVMSGETFKQVDSELRALAEPYMKSPDAAQQQLGQLLMEVRTAMRDGLARQNPQYARPLQDINNAFAMMARVGQASNRRLQPGTGVFSPMDLLSAVRSQDASRRHRAFAHGDALMQDWAEAAQRVLPSRMPDSGTMERALYTGTALGLLSGEAERLGPHAPQLGIAALLASAPYTRLGQAAINAAAKNRTAQGVRRGLVGASPYVAPALSTIATQPSLDDLALQAQGSQP